VVVEARVYACIVVNVEASHSYWKFEVEFSRSKGIGTLCIALLLDSSIVEFLAF
jgi:hypothetical protein